MKVLVKGVVVENHMFFSDKRNRDVTVTTLYSGGETAKVYDVPLDLVPDLYSEVTMPAKLYEGNKGIGFIYDDEK